MDGHIVIDQFISSDDIVQNLGILNYYERRNINDYSHKLGIHTISISEPDSQHQTINN